MLRIGEFSRLAMVTVKTLRFYEEKGLIKPKKVDDQTGYRYYETEQIYNIHEIMALKQAGLSIIEIKKVLSGQDVSKILNNRKNELEKNLKHIQEQSLRITRLIKQLKENEMIEFKAVVKEIPEYSVFYGIKKLKGFQELTPFILSLGQECKNNNPNLKCITPDYCFVCYLDEEFTDVNFTAMYAQAVEKMGKESKNVKFKSAPAITAVSVMVKGDYSNLPLGYAFAMKWLKENGYKITDKPRECYLDGVWNKNNVDDYLTEIQIPVQKI